MFTGNKLSQMGLVNTEEHVAWVVYPEQKREYKLYDISLTRKRKRQKNSGLILTRNNMSVEEVLKEREHEMKVRRLAQLTQLSKHYEICVTPQFPEQKKSDIE